MHPSFPCPPSTHPHLTSNNPPHHSYIPISLPFTLFLQFWLINHPLKHSHISQTSMLSNIQFLITPIYILLLSEVFKSMHSTHSPLNSSLLLLQPPRLALLLLASLLLLQPPRLALLLLTSLLQSASSNSVIALTSANSIIHSSPFFPFSLTFHQTLITQVLHLAANI